MKDFIEQYLGVIIYGVSTGLALGVMFWLLTILFRN